MNFKKITAVILAVVFTLGLSVQAFAADPSYRVTSDRLMFSDGSSTRLIATSGLLMVNGTIVPYGLNFNLAGIAFLPIRCIAEELGITFIDRGTTAELQFMGMTVVMTDGSSIISLAGRNMDVGFPIRVVDGEFSIPYSAEITTPFGRVYTASQTPYAVPVVIVDTYMGSRSGSRFDGPAIIVGAFTNAFQSINLLDYHSANHLEDWYPGLSELDEARTAALASVATVARVNATFAYEFGDYMVFDKGDFGAMYNIHTGDVFIINDHSVDSVRTADLFWFIFN